jgi:hypothetical protein
MISPVNIALLLASLLLIVAVSTTPTLAFTPYSSGLSHRAFVRTPLLSASSASSALTMSQRYSDPDQPARFAQAKAEQNQRYLDITTVYDPSFLKGKRVAVTGANRGIGLALATELTAAGAKVVAIVRSSSPELDALKPAEVVTGIDVTNDEQCANGIASQIKGGPIDIVRFLKTLTWTSLAVVTWKTMRHSLALFVCFFVSFFTSPRVFLSSFMLLLAHTDIYITVGE